MADDRDSMASSLLESLGEDELLRILSEGLASQASVPRGSVSERDDPSVAQRLLVGGVVRVILERSFPALAGGGDLEAIEADVTDALIAHEQSLRRIERLAASLRQRFDQRGGRA